MMDYQVGKLMNAVLDHFRDEYLKYLEGDLDTPPTPPNAVTVAFIQAVDNRD